MPHVQGKVKTLPVCVAASVQHSPHHGPGEGAGTGRHHQGPAAQGSSYRSLSQFRGPQTPGRVELPLTKKNYPFPLALDHPISKPSFWEFWSLLSLALAGSEGFLPWVSDLVKEVENRLSPAKPARWAFYSGSTPRAFEARYGPILEVRKGASLLWPESLLLRTSF